MPLTYTREPSPSRRSKTPAGYESLCHNLSVIRQQLEDNGNLLRAIAAQAHVPGPSPNGDSQKTTTLETLQAGIDTLNQAVDTVRHTTDTVRHTTEAIAKNEEELARRLDSVRLNTEAIAKNDCQLRRENTELHALAEGGFLRFATRVDAVDFRAFAAIMVTGNRYEAAKSLQTPKTTFYRLVDAWPSRGADYKRMYLMTEWRKKTARKIKVRLDDSLLGTEVDGQAENPETRRAVLASMRDKTDEKSRDELLLDILQALTSQTADNWQSIRDELIPILKAEVPQ